MTHAQADDFDIAKAIFEQLKDLPPQRQQRVLRWIAEAIGASLTVPQAAPHEGGMPPVPVPPVASRLTGRAPTDIKTFIAAKSPKSDQQFATAVAYFYRFEAAPTERRDSVNSDFLQEAARLAGRRRLANPLTTLHNAKGAGYLDNSSRGEFTINSVGENLVAMTLPGGTEPSAKKKRVNKKRTKAKSSDKHP